MHKLFLSQKGALKTKGGTILRLLLDILVDDRNLFSFWLFNKTLHCLKKTLLRLSSSFPTPCIPNIFSDNTKVTWISSLFDIIKIKVLFCPSFPSLQHNFSTEFHTMLELIGIKPSARKTLYSLYFHMALQYNLACTPCKLNLVHLSKAYISRWKISGS